MKDTRSLTNASPSSVHHPALLNLATISCPRARSEHTFFPKLNFLLLLSKNDQLVS